MPKSAYITLCRMSNQLREAIRNLGDRQLRDLIAACGAVNTTNCGWHVYLGAPSIQMMACEELAERTSAKKQDDVTTLHRVSR